MLSHLYKQKFNFQCVTTFDIWVNDVHTNNEYLFYFLSMDLTNLSLADLSILIVELILFVVQFIVASDVDTVYQFNLMIVQPFCGI